MNLLERGQNIINKISDWNERRTLSKICGDNLVDLGVIIVENGIECRRFIPVYDGSSDGYKKDYKIDKGKLVLDKMRELSEDVSIDLILRPKNTNHNTDLRAVNIRK